MEASGTGTDDVSDKIEFTNPVLEAFGNAKTRNNDNSSRFGKYLKVFLNDKGAVTGAKAEHYLLETARVVKKDDNERNYHIFYMMLAPVPAGQPAPLDLTLLHLHHDAQQYAYLKHEELHTDRRDHEDFVALRQAFRDLQFNLDAEQAVYKVLAGILHCGNVVFESQDADAAIVRQDDALQYAAKCFGVKAAALSKSFCIKQGTKSEVQRTTVQAKAARDTLCKYLYVGAGHVVCGTWASARFDSGGWVRTCRYGYVFDFLVHSLNAITATPDIEETRFIGCLDIFGFEKMKTNSLEQLCINYTNEKLQEQFNDVTVEGEIAHLKAQEFQLPIAYVSRGAPSFAL
jgi:myosin-5